MIHNTREITQAEYEEIMRESNGRGIVPEHLETKYFSPTILRGYGLYGTRVYTRDGKYYLDYNTGSSCD